MAVIPYENTNEPLITSYEYLSCYTKCFDCKEMYVQLQSVPEKVPVAGTGATHVFICIEIVSKSNIGVQL